MKKLIIGMALLIMSFSGFAQEQSSDDSGSNTLLVEFDTRDYPLMGAAKVNVTSLEIRLKESGTKIGENLYLDKGRENCHWCIFMLHQAVKYTVIIPLEESLSLRHLGLTFIWHEKTAKTEREYSVPSGILERDTSDSYVLRKVASSARRVLGLVSAVRRGEVTVTQSEKTKTCSKKTKTCSTTYANVCYTTYLRGTYNPETLLISSMNSYRELIKCPDIVN